MMQKIIQWWNTERVNRFEKGTSQDYCPTNGGAVCYFTVWSIYPLALLAALTIGE